MDGSASIAPEPTVEETVKELLAPPSRPTKRQRHDLPDIVLRLAELIKQASRAQETIIHRTALSTLLTELGDSLQRAAEHIETLTGQPVLHELQHGPQGILEALGGNAHAARFRLAAIQARAWEHRMGGPGRHTPVDVVDHPRPELITAMAIVRLFQLLARQRPASKNVEHDCQLCERLWRLSGNPASGSVGRWKNFLAIARQHKPGRPKALTRAQNLVDNALYDTTLRPLLYAEALEQMEQTINTQ